MIIIAANPFLLSRLVYALRVCLELPFLRTELIYKLKEAKVAYLDLLWSRSKPLNNEYGGASL